LTDKMFVALAGDVASEGDILFGGAELEAVIISVEIAARCGAEQIDLIAVGAEREAWENSRVGVELSFIENAVPARCDDGAVGNTELDRGAKIVCQVPAAYIHGVGIRVMKLDAVRQSS